MEPILTYSEQGTGPPTVLCLHSLGTDGRMWYRVENHLPGLRLIAPDLLGHGGSSTLGEFDFARNTQCLIDLCRRADADKVIVTGVGLGALAAVHLAAESPALVSGLVLMSSYVSVPDNGRDRLAATRSTLMRTPFERFAKGYARDALAPTASDDLIEEVVEMLTETGDVGFQTALEAAMQFQGTALLSNVKAPSLVLTGALDKRTSERDGRAVAGKLADSEFTLVSDAAHLLPLDEPALIAEMITRIAHEISG